MAEKRNTIQKEIIHQTLCGMHNHPTAAMVYDQVHLGHPTISRSTVYRVLGQLAEEGRVLRLAWRGRTACTTAISSPTGMPAAVCAARWWIFRRWPWRSRRTRRLPAGGVRGGVPGAVPQVPGGPADTIDPPRGVYKTDTLSKPYHTI